MILATSTHVKSLIALHSRKAVERCPAITINPDGTAAIDNRSREYLALLQSDVKAPRLTTAQHLLAAARGELSGIVKEPKRFPQPAGPDVWGPRLWNDVYDFIHAYAGDEEAAKQFFIDLIPRVKCGDCRAHYERDLKDSPPDTSNRDSLFQSIHALHNRINARNGKPQLPLSIARQRWGLEDAPRPATDYFGMAMVISLSRTPERLSRFWHTFPIDWPFERPGVFDAVDGESEQPPANWHAGNGAWGLVRSCIEILKRYLAAETEKPLLIFEDDCEWLDGKMPDLLRFIGRLPADFDCAFPGAQHLNAAVPYGRNLVRAMGAHRMHCIIVARHYADPLLRIWESWAHVRNTTLPQDHALTEQSGRRRFYAAEPFLCFQSANVSNLLGHHVPDRGGSGGWQTGISIGRPDPEIERYDRTWPLRCGGQKRFIDVRERDAFNGTCIDTPAGRLLVFRGDALGTIKYRWLDGEANTFQLPLNCNDDPRLAWHQNRLYLSTNYWWGRWAGGRMELREIEIDDRHIKLGAAAKFDVVGNWPGYTKPEHEKNWVPFSHAGKLLYVYSINPHRILEVDLAGKSVSLLCETTASTIPWPIMDGSELRCSAPPVLLPSGEYLSTFHVRREKDYWTGFYTFEATAPFRVTAMSCTPVLWPEDSDGVCWRNGNMRLLFVQGMELRGDTLRLWGGDNDHSVMMADIPLAAAVASLRLTREANLR
jgi:hypothetical protein